MAWTDWVLCKGDYPMTASRLYNMDMSLAIAIKVPEGLVLAAESRVSYDIPDGDSKRLVTFDNATKLLKFDDYLKFGAVTFGVANIGTRTAHSFIPEFIAELKKSNVGQNIKVKTFAKKLGEFFKARWEEAMPSDFPKTENMFFVIGGFEASEPHAKVYQIVVPGNTEPEELDSMKQFNSVWGGQYDIVSRMVKGYDDRIIKWVDDNFTATEEQQQNFAELISAIEQPIVYSALALQDAINLAETFIRTTIDIQSLSAGVRGVGGAIDIAIITKDNGFSYIQKKTLTGKIKIEGNSMLSNTIGTSPLSSATPRDWRSNEPIKNPGKKTFKRLIKKASQPVPKEQEK